MSLYAEEDENLFYKFCNLFYKDTNLIHKGKILITQLLPKDPTLQYHHIQY